MQHVSLIPNKLFKTLIIGYTVVIFAACTPFTEESKLEIQQPKISWDLENFHYGNVDLGTTASVTFKIVNHGELPVVGCGPVQLSDRGNFEIIANTCLSDTMPTHGDCAVEVRARPLSAGQKSLTLSRECSNNVLVRTAEAGIVAIGVAPELRLSNDAHDFADIIMGQTPPPFTFTIENAGSTTATGCTAATLTNSIDFHVVGDSCGVNPLPAGATCAISVSADPQSLGQKSTTLARTCNFGGEIKTQANMIKAKGIFPLLAVAPLTKSFGSAHVGSSTGAEVFTIANAGTATATGCSAPVLSNSADFLISLDTCGTASLIPSASCDVTVTAHPMSAGLRETTLSRTCTLGGVASTTSQLITVTGQAPVLAWLPLSHDFSTINVGSTSAVETFTLSNSGSAPATGCGAVSLNDTTNFSLASNACGVLDLPNPSSCTVGVQAHPQSPGLKQATLSRTCTFGGVASTTSQAIAVSGIVSAFTQHWPFDTGTESNYDFDPARAEIAGNVIRLSRTDLVDDDNTATGFGGATLTASTYGTLSDGVSQGLKMDPVQASARLDSNWVPQPARLISYIDMQTAGVINPGDQVNATVGPQATYDYGSPLLPTHAQVDQGLYFQGWNGLRVPLVNQNDGPNDTLTVSFWLNSAGPCPSCYGHGEILSIGGRIVFAFLPTGNIGLTQGFGDYVEFNLPERSRWVHIVMDLKKNNLDNSLVYVNGQPRPMTRVSGSNTGFDFTGDILIGSAHYSQNFGLTGGVDEFAVWNGSLTPAEIFKLYEHQSSRFVAEVKSRVLNAHADDAAWTSLSWLTRIPHGKELPDAAAGVAQSESTLHYPGLVNPTLMQNNIGLWHFNESVIGTAADSSASGLHASAQGGLTINADGRWGQAVKFDGSSGYFSVGNSPTVQLTSGTVSGWIKANDGVGGHAGLIVKQFAYGLYLFNGEFIVYDFSTGTNLNTGVYMVDGRWHHVAVTFQSGVVGGTMLYVDGTLRLVSQLTVTDQLQPLLIGYGNAAAQFHNGSIDEVALWNRVLSGAEISQLYRRGGNRIKFQVRTCVDAQCVQGAPAWQGPDGSPYTYFSEFHHRAVQSVNPAGAVLLTAPMVNLSSYVNPVADNRFFQYRAVLESDVNTPAMMPELRSFQMAGPTALYDSVATIVGKTGVNAYDLSAFTQTLGAGGCTGLVYNVGVGATSDAAVWSYWNGSTWAAAGGTAATANTAASIQSRSAAFPSSSSLNKVFIKTFLKSDGQTACDLDNLRLDGRQ